MKTKGRMVNGQLVPGQGIKGSTVSVQGRTPVLVNEDDGSFSFPTPNTQFRLDSVKKKGYQLVDVEACPKSYERSSNPLYIIMETPEQQLQDKLNAERKIRRNLQKQLQAKEDEIEALKEENAISMEEYQKLLQQLYAEQESNEHLISDMAKRYSELDYDQLDDFYRQVSYCIENGDLVKADSLLNTRGDVSKQVEEQRMKGQALHEQEQTLSQAKAVHAADNAELAKRCYSYYETFAAQHLNDTAAYYLDLRASLDTTNIEWLIDAGSYFLNYVANYDKAMSLFNTALRQSLLQKDSNPGALVDVYTYIGLVYFSTADYKKALDNLQLALELGRQNYGEDNVKVATALHYIGQVHYKQSDYKSALEHFLAALKINEKVLGKEDSRVATLYNDIGVAYFAQSDVDRAMECHEKALKIQEKTVGLEHKDVTSTYHNFGILYSYKGDHENALKYYNLALEILETQFGDYYPQTAKTYANIGWEYYSLGNYEKTLEYSGRTILMSPHAIIT